MTEITVVAKPSLPLANRAMPQLDRPRAGTGASTSRGQSLVGLVGESRRVNRAENWAWLLLGLSALLLMVLCFVVPYLARHSSPP